MKKGQNSAVTVKRTDLVAALSSAARCLEKRSSIPVLSMFRLISEAPTLTIVATDLDQSARVVIPAVANLSGDFDILVDGKLLAAVAPRLDSDEVELELDLQAFVIKREQGDIRLRTRKAEDFPDIQFGKDYKVTFEANELNEVCHSLLLGTTEERSLHNSPKNVAELSIERNLVEGKFKCISTDMHRLAIVNGLCYTDIAEPFKIQVPVAAVRMLQTALKGVKGQIRLGEDDNHIYIEVGETKEFSFRKRTATFPNIAAYLEATKFDRTVKLDAEQIRDSLELAALCIDYNRKVRLILNGDLTISAASADTGEVRDSIEAEIDFEGFEVGFNIDYLLPLFRQLSGEIELIFAKDERYFTNTKGEQELASVSYPLRVTKFQNNVTTSFDIQSLSGR